MHEKYSIANKTLQIIYWYNVEKLHETKNAHEVFYLFATKNINYTHVINSN